MTITYLGSLSLGDVVPGAAAAGAAGMAGINGALPDILGRLAALQAFVPSPVDFGLQLALAESMVSSVTAAIALGLPVPSIALQIAAILALISELLAQVAAINVQLAIVADFVALLGAAGIAAFAYDGAVSSLGGEVAFALADGVPGGSPSDHCNALVLATSVPATWLAMAQVFKVAV